MVLRSVIFAATVLLAGTALAQNATAPAAATPPASSKAVSSENGKYVDAEGNPTYSIQADGTVDWFTYSGFRMYHAECHVCHGPDAMGSSYAPALKDSLKTIDYYKFLEIVSSGQQNKAHAGEATQFIMPAFGTNRNVMCYVDDLYVYLRARADGALDRGRPAKKEAKSAETRKANEECLNPPT